jgi:hypothetical protein
MLENDDNPEKAIILLSDGDPAQPPNVYVDDNNPDQILRARNAGIDIYTIAYIGINERNAEIFISNMCCWSASGICGLPPAAPPLDPNCYTGPYAYTSLNAPDVYDAISRKILAPLPPSMEVIVNGVATSFAPVPDEINHIILNSFIVDCPAADTMVGFSRL